jgi:hypothetical protein
MKNAQRLDRLEQQEAQQRVLRNAERIADRYGVDPEDVLCQAGAIARRIERWGVEAEVRRLATTYGVSEDDVWERYSIALASWDVA